MTPQEIDHFEQGGERLSQAIRGLTREDMLRVPPAEENVGRWSIHQIVIHLQDADLVSIDRMHRTIAEDKPQLVGYDEQLFAKNLCYDEQSVEDAVQMVTLARRQAARIFRNLTPDVFQRVGMHNERGPETLEHQIRSYDKHLDHHISFIHKKRAWMGREMW